MGGNSFTAKVKIKRKSLPSSPIHVKISATPENKMDGGSFGSPSPVKADEAAFSTGDQPKPKIKGPKLPSGRRGSYK